jgi:hypothetical protein
MLTSIPISLAGRKDQHTVPVCYHPEEGCQMKKNQVKKLQLSRETVKLLTTSDTQKVAGGVAQTTMPSCTTNLILCYHPSA